MLPPQNFANLLLPSLPPQPPAAALSAPTQLRDTLSTLREIMSVYATSLLEHEHETTQLSPLTRENDFKDVVDAVLDPAMQMCETMAEMRTSGWDRDVFRVNCDEAVLGALDGFDFVGGRRMRVKGGEEGHVESLTVEHVSFASFVSCSDGVADSSVSSTQFTELLKTSGLEPVITALRTKEAEVRRRPSLPLEITLLTRCVTIPQTHLSQNPSASPSHLITASTTFSTFLSTIDPVSSPRLSLLPPHLAASIHADALKRVSEAYGELYDAVLSEESGYEGRETLLRRRKEEVEMLLDVQ